MSSLKKGIKGLAAILEGVGLLSEGFQEGHEDRARRRAQLAQLRARQIESQRLRASARGSKHDRLVAQARAGKKMRKLPVPDGMVLKVANVRTLDQRVKYIREMIQKGRNDPRIRALTVKIVSRKCGKKHCVDEKDHVAEVKAVFDWVRKNVRYVRDSYDRDTFQHPVRTIQFGGGDCFPVGTLMLRDDEARVPVEGIQVGDRIYDGRAFVSVVNKWDRGPKTIHRLELSNDKTLRLSDNHKVIVVQHDGSELEKRVHELSVGMGLLQPHGLVTRIRSIVLEESPDECFDVATESGRIYLPQSDVVVRNCDDYSIVLSSMLQSIGYPVRLRVIKTHNASDWNHIYIQVGLPPGDPTHWMNLDGSENRPAGWAPPDSMIDKVRDFEID